MCRSTFIRTKEPFSEAPFLLPVRRKKRKTDCISSFCKGFYKGQNENSKSVEIGKAVKMQ